MDESTTLPRGVVRAMRRIDRVLCGLTPEHRELLGKMLIEEGATEVAQDPRQMQMILAALTQIAVRGEWELHLDDRYFFEAFGSGQRIYAPQ